MQAVCDAARADKARHDWLETELDRQKKRANASELEKAALHDRVRQLEVRLYDLFIFYKYIKYKRATIAVVCSRTKHQTILHWAS